MNRVIDYSKGFKIQKVTEHVGNSIQNCKYITALIFSIDGAVASQTVHISFDSAEDIGK